jgi:hypothetical protein
MEDLLEELVREYILEVLEEQRGKKAVPKKRSKFRYRMIDFDQWSPERLRSYWDTLHKNYRTFDAKVQAISRHMDKINNPEEFVARLQRKVTGRWPKEIQVEIT